jgi:SAM-dependent MidA family methyltransferase
MGEIGVRGAITFARFMELALYCPNCGYYEKEKDIIGRRGDYYTSVSVGSLFGELLAFQFAEWMKTPQESQAYGGAGEAKAVRIVEAGAHDGALARDILVWLRQHRPSLYQALEYWIVEPSERRRTRQQQTLHEFGDQVRWVAGLAELRTGAESSLPLAHSRCVFFSNELLDAMPVHRLGWDAKAGAWFEWGVTLQAGRFVWTRMISPEPGSGEKPATAPYVTSHPLMSVDSRLLASLPDGFTIEWSPAAEDWWQSAGLAMGCGTLLTIDYGLTAEELLAPERKAGTLRGYHGHRLTGDVLASPGEQDLTAHVNFSALRAAGESVGLRTEALLTQAQFLAAIAARTWADEGSFGKWTPERRRQFQTLVHPEHLGRSFRVLAQSRT